MKHGPRTSPLPALAILVCAVSFLVHSNSAFADAKTITPLTLRSGEVMVYQGSTGMLTERPATPSTVSSTSVTTNAAHGTAEKSDRMVVFYDDVDDHVKSIEIRSNNAFSNVASNSEFGNLIVTMRDGSHKEKPLPDEAWKAFKEQLGTLTLANATKIISKKKTVMCAKTPPAYHPSLHVLQVALNQNGIASEQRSVVLSSGMDCTDTDSVSPKDPKDAELAFGVIRMLRVIEAYSFQ